MKRWLCLLTSLLALASVTFFSEAVQARKHRAPTVHVVHAGQTLGRIAKRYNVSIDAICHASGILRRSPIKPGQKLLVPGTNDKDGKQARQKRLKGHFKKHFEAAGPRPKQKKAARKKKRATKPMRSAAKSKRRSWLKYKRPARRRGYVVLKATGRSWRGYAIIKGNRVASRARKGFKHSLYSWRTGNEVKIHPRLIRLLARVSDEFGGRPLRIASGYRERSHSKESKHKEGRACDFSVPGVPNAALRDYLKTLDRVGVGYYPNSSFVHLDVRAKSTAWVDLARPGQAPRYLHKRRRGKPTKLAATSPPSTPDRPGPESSAKESKEKPKATVAAPSSQRTPDAAER